MQHIWRVSAGLSRCFNCTTVHLYMRLLATETRSTTGPLFTSQCLYATSLPTLYSMVWHWRISSATMVFHWPKLLALFLSSTVFPLSSFFQWVGIMRLVLWGLALPTFLMTIIINSQYHSKWLKADIQLEILQGYQKTLQNRKVRTARA